MPSREQEEVTVLLDAIANGDRSAWTRLAPIVHRQIHEIARARIAGLAPGNDVRATELVNETFLRLLPGSSTRWIDRRHFYAAVSLAMRDLLVDEARRRGRLKRGGGWNRVTLDERFIDTTTGGPDMLAIDEALTELRREDERLHEIVMLRYFAGLSIDEVAEVVGVSASTVDRQWKYAKARLHRQLSEGA